MAEPDDHGGALWRGVIGFVLIGAVLGIGHNAMQRAAGPRRGLPWIKQEVKLASLESIDAAGAADSTAADSSAHARATPAAPDSSAYASAARDTARTKGTRHAGKPATPEASTPGATNGAKPAVAPPGATATPAGGTTTPPATTPAVAAPSVPDTREPLEAQYASIKKLWDAGVATFVDARTPDEYAAGHIPGSVNMPFDDVFKDPEKAKTLQTRGRPVVITYCGGGDCDLSRNLAFSLIDAGHKKVLVFMGGTPGWTDGGNALVKGTSPGDAP